MDAEDEKRWKMIEQVLAAESTGKRTRMLSSKRTLFGIPSKLDSELAAYAASQRVSDVGNSAETCEERDYETCS